MEMKMAKKTEKTGISMHQADLLRKRLKDIVIANAQTCKDLYWAVYESDVQMVRNGSGQLEYCWKVWGYDTWEDYVGKELDMHVTTAYAFKKIWEVFWVDLAGAWDESLLLGVSKMRILTAAALTKQNVNKWLKKAATMNCRLLRAEVFGTEELKSFTAIVSASNLQRLNKIIDQGRNTFGEDLTRGEVLTNILKSWADDHPKTRLRKVG